MEVKDEPDFALLADLLNKRLDGVHFGTIQVLFCGIPLSIEVLSGEVSAVVAEDHAVRIDHWDHIDHIILQEKIRLL
jgi:hypothetical protein